MDPHDLTLLLALAAGVVSFISPCVLPLVPAYLGQLAGIAARTADPATGGVRGVVLGNAAAYVLGFGLVFTLLGVTAYNFVGPLVGKLPVLRQIGGAILVVMGLALAGILPVPFLSRTWRPLDVRAAQILQGRRATAMAEASAGYSGPPPRSEPPLPHAAAGAGASLVGLSGGLATSFGIGAVFAVGWTPCIGPILGAILAVAVNEATLAQAALLLIAYSAGLAIPFLALALVIERAPRVIRPLLRHGAVVSLIGGLLVAAMGVVIFFDVLFYFNRYFFFGV